MKNRLVMLVVAVAVIASIAGLAGCAPEVTTPEGAPPEAAPPEAAPSEEEEEQPSAPAEEVIHWRFQTITTPEMVPQKYAFPDFCDRVRAMSDGRLDIELYAAGELLSAADMLDGLVTGIIELGYTGTCFYTGVDPVGNLSGIGVPIPLWNTFQDARQLYWMWGLDEVQREAWLKHGIYYVGCLQVSTAGFWSRDPMYNIKDLKGFKIRTYTQMANLLEALGAVPVYIPHEEAFAAVQLGTVDGGGTTFTHYYAQRWYEVCPYIYYPEIMTGGIEFIASLDAWNELPDDLKEIVSVATRACSDDCFSYDFRLKKEMESLYDEWGTTPITLSDEDMEAMHQIALSQLDEVATLSPACAEGVEIIKEYLKFAGYSG